MAKKKRRSKKQRAQAAARRSRAKSRKKSGPDPLKSMGIGALIVVALLVFFTVRIGDRTPFNHLIDAFGGGEEAEQSGDSAESAAPPKSKPAPARPGVARGAEDAPPMETVTDEEQEGLDDLIDQKTNQ